ncbi:hypothetical protein KKC32_00845 [Patescibacteria group bacterium]|nr:hypothetical protein [Patescibacteria group bacterium]
MENNQENQNKMIEEIFEMVVFIKDQAATQSSVDEGFKCMDERFDQVDEKFKSVDERFDSLDSRLKKVESTMVTKDYLDDKLADLRGDLVVMMRKEDTKLKTLVEILEEKNLLTETDKQKIFSLEPFARIN